MRAIERTAPAVLADLRATVLPAFRAALAEFGISLADLGLPGARGPTVEQFMAARKAGRPHRDHFFATMVRLEPAVYKWGSRWGLCRDEQLRRHRHGQPSGKTLYWEIVLDTGPLVHWMLPVIVDTVATWADVAADTRPTWQLGLATEYGLRLEMPAFELAVAGWKPGTETRSAFRVRARQVIDNGLAAYLAECEAQLTPPHSGSIAEVVPSLATAPVKAVSRTAARHFDWLVRRLMLGESWPRIAAGTDRSWRAIKEGAHRAAKLIIGPKYKSWLHAGRPGRPRARH
jgi:hypothetical protein